MKTSLIILLFINLNELNAQYKKIRLLPGTWINLELFKELQQDNLSVNLDNILPRCLYIDSSNKLVIEYRYEQKSSNSTIKEISTKNGQKVFKALDRSFSLVNDSMLLLSNYGRKIYFKKINNKATLGDGVQAMLRQHFWDNYKEWQMVTVKNEKIIDTIMVFMGKTMILNTKKKCFLGNMSLQILNSIE